MRAQFHKGAKRDLLDGFRWYQKDSDRVASEFYDEVSATLDKLLMDPTRFRLWKSGSQVRVIKVERYPYHLYYTITGPRITIVATAHEKRRPGYWRRRVK